MKDSPVKDSPKFYAKAAGVLILVSIIAGGFGEIFVVSKLVMNGNADATAHNILKSEPFFRLGFASYLIEAICDVCLAFIFYFLLKPINKSIALLTIGFGLVCMLTFSFAELFYISTPLILHAVLPKNIFFRTSKLPGNAFSQLVWVRGGKSLWHFMA